MVASAGDALTAAASKADKGGSVGKQQPNANSRRRDPLEITANKTNNIMLSGRIDPAFERNLDLIDIGYILQVWQSHLGIQ